MCWLEAGAAAVVHVSPETLHRHEQHEKGDGDRRKANADCDLPEEMPSPHATTLRSGCAYRSRSEVSYVPGVSSTGHRNVLANACEGVIQPRVCRGRPLSLRAMALSCCWLGWDRSELLGRN
jgi:hypothetical protein